MNATKVILIILYNIAAYAAVAQTPHIPSNGVVIPFSNYYSNITAIEPETQAMIDTWAKGASTNGLYCAVQVTHDKGKAGTDPEVYVNIVNTTTNFFRTCLGLPREVRFQMTLLDPQGKTVDPTPAGTRFMTWNKPQMEDWLVQQLRSHSRGTYFEIWPFGYSQVGLVSIGELFQLKQAGDFTLHLRMLLVVNHPDAAGHNHLEITQMPEVAAKAEIRPEDLSPGQKLDSKSGDPKP